MSLPFSCLIISVTVWLQAALYQTDFRPVPLEEYIKVGNTIYDKQMDVVRTISKTADLSGKDPDHIVELCNEVGTLPYHCVNFSWHRLENRPILTVAIISGCSRG